MDVFVLRSEMYLLLGNWLLDGLHWLQSPEITQGATAGVIGSVIFGAMLLARDRFRSNRLRQQIKTSLQNLSAGSGIDGLHVTIANRTGRAFTVRHVLLVTPKHEVVLQLSNQVGTVEPPRDYKFTKDDKQRLKRGEYIEVGLPRLSFSRTPTQASDEVFATIEPFMSRQYHLPLRYCDPEMQAVCFRFLVEYRSWTDSVVLLQVDTIPRANKIIQIQLAGLLRQIADGTLDAARKRFGLPAITSDSEPPSVQENVVVCGGMLGCSQYRTLSDLRNRPAQFILRPPLQAAAILPVGTWMLSQAKKNVRVRRSRKKK